MWPNVMLDNVFVKHPNSLHAAEEVSAGHEKWAANAWIHLRDFRSRQALGLLSDADVRAILAHAGGD